ncbi:MAG: Holliday junction branch migration DNA helicase RuvB [Candidatus Gracilibacteria bacterium]
MIKSTQNETIRENTILEQQETAVDQFENTLRPTSFSEYIGQTQMKKNLHVSLEAAKERGEPLEHLLFYGPPGLGKTTISNIIAHEMGVSIKVTSGPAIEKPGDLASLLTNLQEHDILFIDEIHRLKTTVEEVLYSAMEDYCIDLMIGKGPSARSMRLNLPKFTLIGATTKMNMLSSPLRDRFGHVFRLEYYTDEEMTEIIIRSAKILNIKCTKEGAVEIAKRSRKTPRIANRLLKRVRDFAQVGKKDTIDLEVANEALSHLNIDEFGLDYIDRHLLLTMIEKFGGRPIGLGTLAAATSEEEGTIEEVYEPFLLQLGFIERTPRGRKPTEKAYIHLGMQKLFVKNESSSQTSFLS